MLHDATPVAFIVCTTTVALVSLVGLGSGVARAASPVIYLNGGGQTLRAASEDDSVRNRSAALVDSAMRSISVPAFGGSADDWNALATCVGEIDR